MPICYTTFRDKIRMKIKIAIISLIISTNVYAQKTVEDFGYVHHQVMFQSDTVNFIVKSKKGDEQKRKPILLFIQGSLAKPLIKYKENGTHYPPFSFSEDLFIEEFHLICINKPGLPIVKEKFELDLNGEFRESTSNLPPKIYTQNANLTYYTERNNRVIQYLVKETWVDTNTIVVAGHSEGASIAVKMAVTNNSITHLIYSGGTPYYSRILSIITQDRKTESEKESWIERDFDYWEQVNEKPFDVSREHGRNAFKGTYTFSENLNDDFKRIAIPTLVTYGTKDTACPFNDLLRIEMIQEKKDNIQFNDYFNREHNYFEVLENGNINYENFGWDTVAMDWKKWIKMK